MRPSQHKAVKTRGRTRSGWVDEYAVLSNRFPSESVRVGCVRYDWSRSSVLKSREAARMEGLDQPGNHSA